MVRFLAIQHTLSEYFGALEPHWEARGIDFDYLRPVTGEGVGGVPGRYDALWLLGGASPAAERARCPWLDDELRLVRGFERAQRPVVGLGLGAQVLAAAHGAMLDAEPAFDVRVCAAQAVADDPLAHALDGRAVLVWTQGGARLAPPLEPVLADADGRWLAFRTPRLGYGLSFRPDLKPGMLEDMAMEEDRRLPAHYSDFLVEVRERWPELSRGTDAAVAALVGALGLMEARRKMPVFRLVRGG